MLEELIIRTLCDTLPERPADGLFLFGQTADNQVSVFATARKLLQQKRVPKVLFIYTEALSGYPGYACWQKELTQRGIAEQALEAVPVPAGTDMLHTLIEAEAMAIHAKKQGYTRMIVTASPFQQPRAFMAAVTATLRIYPQLYLYSVPGKALTWKKEVTHSQGEVQDTRAGLIAGEIERIHKYHAQGDLASVDQVLAYLDSRDSARL